MMACVGACGCLQHTARGLCGTPARLFQGQQPQAAQRRTAAAVSHPCERHKSFHQRILRRVQAVPLQQTAKRRSWRNAAVDVAVIIVRGCFAITMVSSQLVLNFFVCKFFLLVPPQEQAQWLRLHPIVHLACIVLTVWWFVVLPKSRLFETLHGVVQRSIYCVCNRALPWMPKWYRGHLANALSKLVENVGAGSMRFIALCIAVTAIPPSWQLPMNEHLRFLDANGDGIIEANEIEDWVLKVLTRLFIAFRALDLGSFFLEIKQLPTEELGDLSERMSLATSSSKPWLHTFIVRFFRETHRLDGSTGSGTGILILLDRLLTAIIYIVMLMPWLKVFGLRVQTVVALGGVSGLAVGLASKNLVDNGIATVLIHLHRRFHEGEEIESRGKKIRGMVSSIGFQSTVVNQLDGMPICVPNSMLLNDALVNRSTKHFRTVEENLHVILEDMSNMGGLLQKAGDALENHPEVLSKQEVEALKAELKGALKINPPIVCYLGVSERGLIIYVRAYVRGSMSDDAFLRIKSDILLRINDVILEFGGSFAFRNLSPWAPKEETQK